MDTFDINVMMTGSGCGLKFGHPSKPFVHQIKNALHLLVLNIFHYKLDLLQVASGHFVFVFRKALAKQNACFVEFTCERLCNFKITIEG